MATLVQNMIDTSWLGKSWETLLEEYATTESHSARVRRLEVSIGQISAQLSAAKDRSYRLEITRPVLDDATWQKITDILSSQALYAAQMLAGSLPVDIQDAFVQSGCSLLPESLDVWSQSAKVVVEEKSKAKAVPTPEQKIEKVLVGEEKASVLTAVYTMLGNLFEEDPWLLLKLYGRTRPQILQALRAGRVNAEAIPPAVNGNGQTNGVHPEETSYTSGFYTARREGENEAPSPVDEQGLEEQIDSFWGVPKRLKHIHHRIESPNIDLVLLRRLGPPPFNQDSLQLYEQFMTLYRQVGDKAIALAYSAETEE